MLRRLLIANRGEIACRIARTCQRLGIEAVGVFADADAGARHVRWLDRAVRLEGVDPLAAFLDTAQLIATARRLGCDAIHPGYGFLAENAAFAEAVGDAGLVFVGPTPAAILAMGDKGRARAIAAAEAVPIIPGALLPAGEEAAACSALGYPLLLKPAAGGGGKGMQVVHAPEALADAVAASRRVALAAFADDALIAEAWLERCRHVEVQVIADHHGHIVTAFERDCSLQRRHQKIVEEAPAPGLDPGLRQTLARDAIRIAGAVDYRNLGTVEFLLAGSRHYFIEMNTRLQVEHPVTEAVTGLDLVEWQLRIASGEPLPPGLVPPAPSGHAIEARLYAEDPSAGFLPSTGRLGRLSLPDDHLRVDAGVDAGDVVGGQFDPLLAKLIAHGDNRQAVLTRLREALDLALIEGLRTNRDFLCEVLAHPDFGALRIHTGRLDAGAAAWDFPLPPEALAALVLAARDDARTGWAAASGFRLNAAPQVRYLLEAGGRTVEASLVLDFPFALQGGRGWVELGDMRHGFTFRIAADEVSVTAGGRVQGFRLAAAAVARQAEATGALTAPMPGKITALAAVAGAGVEAGALLAVVEAMKMEHPIKAPFAGTIRAVHATLGGQVEEGAVLVDLEPSAAAR